MDRQENGNIRVADMTLREHFAALAMQGLLSSEDENGSSFKTQHDLARFAVKYADVLLEALAE